MLNSYFIFVYANNREEQYTDPVRQRAGAGCIQRQQMQANQKLAATLAKISVGATFTQTCIRVRRELYLC